MGLLLHGLYICTSFYYLTGVTFDSVVFKYFAIFVVQTLQYQMEIFQLLHIMHHTHSYFCSKTMSSFTFKTEECDRELIFSHPTLFMKKDNVLNSFGPSRIPCTIITGLYPSMQRPVSSNRSSALCVFISLHVHTE